MRSILASSATTIVLLLCIGQSQGLITSLIGCGVELLANNLLCVKQCRKEHHCSKLESFCKRIKVKLLRKLCNGLLKCACPTCLKCVAKCTVEKFIKNNVCYIGKYLKHLLKALKIYNYFDLSKEEDQIEAMEEVMMKVANPKDKAEPLPEVSSPEIEDIDEDVNEIPE